VINISVADAVILVGAIQATLGLLEPTAILQRLKLDAATLVVSGVVVGVIGLFLKVILE
jgi:hypothetical protein